MRLTLRTLLAYLDDTLAAGEIRTIGEKVAESESAQELIARIKQVTRRRRLTAPPATGPGAFDPNDVAEYLDNTLDAEQVAEIEKQCLESDVHLAEIAACHQILTLVLGEPALVPPKAKERMYGLVKGRESIPYRKAAPARKPSDVVGEEEQLPGLSGAWLKFVLPAAALLLLVALGVAVWALSDVGGGSRRSEPVAQKVDKDRDGKEKPPKDGNEAEKDKDKDSKDKDAKDKDSKDKDAKDKDSKDKDAKDKDAKDKDSKDKDAKDKDGDVDKDKDKVVKMGRRPPPSTDRVPLASFTSGLDAKTPKTPGVLLTRKSADIGPETWTKALPRTKLFSNDKLLTLPGFANVITSDSGVRLLMRGMLPEYQSNLLDAAVTLHDSSKEKEIPIDLDLTLHHGRIYLSNDKESGPATIRLRFEGSEVWEITLASRGDEVGVQLWRTYSDLQRKIHQNPDEEEPFAFLELIILKGEATVNVVNSYESFTQSAGGGKAVLFSWDTNRYHGFVRLDKQNQEKAGQTPWDVYWYKESPILTGLPKEHADYIRNINTAVGNLGARLTRTLKGDTPAKAIKETRAENDLASRLMGVYCMAAIDDVGGVLDALGDNDPSHDTDRNLAAYVLRQWVARGGGNHKLLFDKKNKSGILVTKYKRETEAETLYKLIFVYPPEKWLEQATFEELALYLKHKNVAIAELGWGHLVGLSLGLVRFPGQFNAAASIEERKDFARAVEEMIEKELLPPRPQAPMKDKDKDKDKAKDKVKDKGGKQP